MSFVMTDDSFKRVMLGVSSAAILTPNLIAKFKEEMGLVDACFKALYALGFLVAGWLIDKLGTKKGFSIGIIIWSLAGFLTGFAKSFFDLKIIRALLGVGESTNFPSAIKTVSEWFPKHERSFASGVLNAGSNIGVILTAVLIPFVIINYGWHVVFFITGSLGFILLTAWLVYYKRPEQSKRLSKEELLYIRKDNQPTKKQISFFKLFRYKQAWIFAMGKFFADPIWYFFLTWLPTFFNDNKAFDKKLQLSNFGLTFFIIYFISDMGSIFFGWLATAFMKSGWSENKARKITLLICALCVTPIYFASQTHSLNIAIALIALATAAHQGWSANIYALPANLFPSQYVASVTGFGGTIGTISGIILAASTGFIVAKFGYQPMFIIASCSYLAGLIVIHLILPRFKPIDVR